MGGDRAERIESVVDFGAAALLAGACTVALVKLAAPGMAIFAAPIFVMAWLGLRQVRAQAPVFAVPFDYAPYQFTSLADELTADDEERADPVEAESAAVAEAMLLVDALPAIDEDSRVVRLFGSRQEESAANLLGRIERHLGRDRASTPPDASDALRDALSDLRQSLRSTG